MADATCTVIFAVMQLWMQEKAEECLHQIGVMPLKEQKACYT
jgi:hypothetical protein